jgi:hypothetical protein
VITLRAAGPQSLLSAQSFRRRSLPSPLRSIAAVQRPAQYLDATETVPINWQITWQTILSCLDGEGRGCIVEQVEEHARPCFRFSKLAASA